MKQFLTRAVFLVATGLLLGGCGNNAYSLSEKERAAFKEAAPEVIQAWENGLKADKANDYLAASTNYRAILLNQKITAEQLMAVQTALGGLNSRMNDAAAKGDASAQKALDAAKAGAPQR
jgi:hypothetical protein